MGEIGRAEHELAHLAPAREVRVEVLVALEHLDRVRVRVRVKVRVRARARVRVRVKG